MKKYLVTYADTNYQPAQKACSISAKIFGNFDFILEYNPNNLSNEFKSKNEKILNFSRGAGLWIWKPYIIMDALNKLQNGDFLFYCDSGAFFIRKIDHIIKSMVGDIWVQNIPTIEEQFTKPDLFYLMELQGEKYRKTNQIQSGFIGIRKSFQSIMIIKEWLENCLIFERIDPVNRYTKLTPNFIENRDDQSIFSLICKKYNIIPHKDPTQFGKLPEKYLIYPNMIFKVPSHTKDYEKTIIVLHRSGKFHFITFFKQLLLSIFPRKIGFIFIKKKYKSIH
jgi:hypothetical protein